MPRQRKPLKYASVFEGLSIEELRLLRDESAGQIRAKERKINQIKVLENAKKLRDKICIGNKIVFRQRGTNSGIIKARVIGIFPDKVQVEVSGRKRSVSLVRIEGVE